MKKWNVVSLYSGVGGLDYGFHKNSDIFNIVFANDFEHNACETYRKNFGDCPYLKEGDIKEFIYDIKEEVDIIIGGFPCPSWSLAGKRMGFEDTRGQEFFTCLAAVIKYRPKIFVFENVKGLMSADDGKSLEFMRKAFLNLGYDFHLELINMNEYGVPQKRQRVLLIGTIIDTVTAKEFVPLKEICNKTLSEALSEVGPLGTRINHDLHFGTEKKLKWIKLLKEGENVTHLSEEEIRKREAELGYEPGPIPKSIMGYRRLNGNAIAPTMMFGNTSLPIHPTEPRSISVREAAYIQGFPLDFEFCGGIASKYKQVGNAVPPTFSIKLSDKIKKVLLSLNKDERGAA